MKPLAKLIPSLLTGVFIASLSASVSAKPMALQAKTPAQVEQALTALLNSRDANIQLASYTSTQASNAAASSNPIQPPANKVDHSGKSVSELILAGLAITNEAKEELAPTTSSAPSTSSTLALAPKQQDYAVADIVNVEELEQVQLEKAASQTATIAVTAVNETNTIAEEELPALPAHLVVKEQEMTVTDDVAADEAEVEEIAETHTVEVSVDDVEVEAIAETHTVEVSVDEVEVEEIAEVHTVEVSVDEVRVEEIAETHAVEVSVDEVEVEVEEIAEVQSVEVSVDEVEVEEIAEAPTVVAAVDEFEVREVADVQSAEEQAEDEVQLETASTPVVDNIGAEVSVAIRSAGCPEDFNKVSIPVNGKLCQIFAADFPASMILFIPETPEEVIKYYLASSDSFIEPKMIKQRTMLKSADNNTTLIISKDGGGTQVDILVKSPVI
jgi:hypothetical protein